MVLVKRTIVKDDNGRNKKSKVFLGLVMGLAHHIVHAYVHLPNPEARSTISHARTGIKNGLQRSGAYPLKFGVRVAELHVGLMVSKQQLTCIMMVSKSC